MTVKFGKKIKAAMENKGISQTKMAEKLKVSRQQINNWLKDRNTPNPDALIGIMRLTDKDANYFFGYPSISGNNHIVGDNNQNINQTVNNMTDIEALKQDVALIKQAILALQRSK